MIAATPSTCRSPSPTEAILPPATWTPNRRGGAEVERRDVGHRPDSQELLVLHPPQARTDGALGDVEGSGDPAIAAARVALKRLDDLKVEIVDRAVGQGGMGEPWLLACGGERRPCRVEAQHVDRELAANRRDSRDLRHDLSDDVPELCAVLGEHGADHVVAPRVDVHRDRLRNPGNVDRDIGDGSIRDADHREGEVREAEAMDVGERDDADEVCGLQPPQPRCDRRLADAERVGERAVGFSPVDAQALDQLAVQVVDRAHLAGHAPTLLSHRRHGGRGNARSGCRSRHGRP